MAREETGRLAGEEAERLAREVKLRLAKEEAERLAKKKLIGWQGRRQGDLLRKKFID